MAIVKDLGMVTAYAYAVAGGYEGTEAEFEQMLGQAGITLEQLENLTAVATTLSEGSEATASYSDGVLTFGIPRGNTGATGPQGPQGVQGETGNGIASITKTDTSGLVDTYTITFTDGTTTTFTVTNGADGDITNVAQAFDATKAYSVGDMVLYQGTLYAFTAAHPAGAWVGSDAQAVILADEVTELKDDLSETNERLDDEIAEVNADYYEIAEHVTSRNLFNGNATDGYIGPDGTISSSTTYHYTDFIDVSAYTGRTLYFGNNGNASNCRFLCAYDATITPIPSAGSSSVISSYTVPSDVKYIVVSFSQTVTGYSIEPDYLSSVYTSYYDYNQIKKYPPIDGAVNIPQPTIKTASSLATNGVLTFGNNNSVKRGDQVFTFYCKIPNGLDDDGYIVIGKSGSTGYAFGISATKWNYFINGVAQGGGALHNLTLKDYVYVRILIKDSDGIAYINIRTNGGTYSRTNTSWIGTHGSPYVKNGCTATITDVSFTWTCEAFRHRIWIFGDSYITVANARWPYYLYEWEFNKNILLSGYPGEESRTGYYDWLEALKYGTPSIAIWAYGMNNTDNGAVNADWLAYTRLFLKDCERRDITPILATIPCIPNGNNSYKNAWVRSSGYRYIEFANAVNTAQDASTWFENMLSSDNVHPDIQGAIALACRAIEDVPELMIN